MKNGQFNIEIQEKPLLWKDKKRYLGMPISFTRYLLNEDKLIINTGLLNLQEDEVLLYRIRDIRLNEKIFDRLFKVGDVTLVTTDISCPKIELKNIKNPRKVKEIIGKCVEENRKIHNVRSTEFMNTIDVDDTADLHYHNLDTDNDGEIDSSEVCFDEH